MGSRSPESPTVVEWANGAGQTGYAGRFADALRFGPVAFNCTKGTVSLEALQLAEAGEVETILVDVANPLDFSNGFPPTLTVKDTDSLAEQIQRAFPQLRVVKALNTMNCDIMVNPSLVPGEHSVFVCGDDADAKAQVTQLLGELGWPSESIIDLGELSSARGTEMFLPLWLRIYAARGNGSFNIAVVS